MMFIKIKISVAVVVILSIISFSLPLPRIADAQVEATSVGTTIIGGLSCTVGTTLSTWLVGQITNGLKSLAKNLGSELAKKLGLAALFNSKVPIVNQNNDDKETFLDVAARCFAREIMNDITARMIGAARTSGRDGLNCKSNNPLLRRDCPSFVRDWRRFLSNAQHRGENVFRSVLNSTSLCNNVLNLKNVFNANGQPSITDRSITRVGNLNSFQQRARCTMPQGWTLQKYTNDFAGNGSWSALTRLAEPQNNYYGALLLSMGELAAQRAHEEKGDSQEAGPTGFTARRGKPGDTCLVRSNNSRCVIYKDILTPGSVVGDAVRSTIQEELAWITNVDEWNELISYVMANIMTRILNLSEPSAYDQEDFPRETPPTPWNGRGDFDVGPGPGQTPQPTPDVSPLMVALCASVDYADGCEVFSADDPNLIGNTIGNDIASSIIVGSGVTAIVCTNIDYGGICRPFSADEPDFTKISLGPLLGSWNDKASSIKISLAQPPAGSVVICNDINYGGPCEIISANDPDLTDISISSGASSILVNTGTGTSATICTEVNYGGDCINFNANQPDFTQVIAGSSNLNDRAFSIKIFTNLPAGSIELCADPGYVGTCETFSVDDPDLIGNAIGNDNASSVRVGTLGTVAVVCTDPNYGGTCINFNTNWPDFRNIIAGALNDAASSVRLSVESSTPTPTPTPIPGAAECEDAFDNDGDGMIDYFWNGPSGESPDPDCSDPSDNDESQ